MKSNYLLSGLIGGGFLVLMAIFAMGLKKDPTALDLVTKGEKIPAFSLPTLLDDKRFVNADLTTDKPYYLINFWGSWCPLCYQEHAYLMELSRFVTIFGVNWKDDPVAAKAFISNRGNPFKNIIVDNHSELAIGMGVYGAPETFLITAHGIIMHRYAGAMNQTIWDKEFLPKIQQLGK